MKSFAPSLNSPPSGPIEVPEENLPAEDSEDSDPLQCEQSEDPDHEADVSFQLTAPKIELNFPKDSCRKKSYLHSSEVARVEDLPMDDANPPSIVALQKRFSKVSEAIQQNSINRPNGPCHAKHPTAPIILKCSEHESSEIKRLKKELAEKDKRLKEAYRFIESLMFSLQDLVQIHSNP